MPATFVQFLPTVIKKFSAAFRHFFLVAMHSVRHEFSSVIEKPRERTLDQILNIHSRFEVLGGSVTNVVGKYWLRSKDGTAEEVGTNDKMILFN